MSRLTPQQIVEVLGSVPIYALEDEKVIAERKKIATKYAELKSTPIPDGNGGMLLPGFSYAATEARALWLQSVTDAKARAFDDLYDRVSSTRGSLNSWSQALLELFKLFLDDAIKKAQETDAVA